MIAYMMATATAPFNQIIIGGHCHQQPRPVVFLGEDNGSEIFLGAGFENLCPGIIREALGNDGTFILCGCGYLFNLDPNWARFLPSDNEKIGSLTYNYSPMALGCVYVPVQQVQTRRWISAAACAERHF